MFLETHSPQRPDNFSGDEEDPFPHTTPPTRPKIPCAIFLPADQHVPEPEENDFSLGPSTSKPVDLPSDQPRRLAHQCQHPACYDDYVTDF